MCVCKATGTDGPSTIQTFTVTSEMLIKLAESQGDVLGGLNIPEGTVGKVLQRRLQTAQNKWMICCRGGKSSGALRD